MLLLALLLLLAGDVEVYRTFRGPVMQREKGLAVIRTQQALEAFILRLPAQKVQMKQPAPPNPDPLLQRPSFDFTKRALVVVWSDSFNIPVTVQGVTREGDNLRLDVRYGAHHPGAEPYGYGQYVLVEVDAFPGRALWTPPPAAPIPEECCFPQSQRFPAGPNPPEATPVRLATYNVHHFRGRDTQEGRGPDQFDAILAALRDQACQVYLLQEVPPEVAATVSERMGMVGYYARTTRGQGNLVLVHPTWEVLDQQRVIVNGGFEAGDVPGCREALAAYSALTGQERQLAEPRSLQILKLRGGGRDLVVWNTHLTAGGAEAYEQRRWEELLMGLMLVETHADGLPIVGGGDLNSGPKGRVASMLFTGGWTGVHADIDWLVSKGMELAEVRTDWLIQEGNRLSDHPIVIVRPNGNKN